MAGVFCSGACSGAPALGLSKHRRRDREDRASGEELGHSCVFLLRLRPGNLKAGSFWANLAVSLTTLSPEAPGGGSPGLQPEKQVLQQLIYEQQNFVIYLSCDQDRTQAFRVGRGTDGPRHFEENLSGRQFLFESAVTH